MSINREKPLFYCHGCHESGHVSRLFRHFGTTPEMVQAFISEAGLSARYEKKKAGKVGARIVAGEDPYRGKYVLDDEIIDLYRLAPKSLLNQGFEKGTLRHFEVGFDKQNLRITFPLRNLYGDLVGISGRAIFDTERRYKIYDRELVARTDFSVPSSYTMDSVKQSLLWHAHIIRPILLREEGSIVVTEGFKAAMWVWQAGYQNVTALIGSAVTDFHAEILATYTREVVLFLDNNEAGKKGTFFGARKLEQKGLIPMIARYPDDRQQPDNLNTEEVSTAIRDALSFREWRGENEDVCDEAARRIYRNHRPS